MPDTSVAPFWADLAISAAYDDGIFYQIDGEEGSRSLSIEWKVVDNYSDDETPFDFILTLPQSSTDSVRFSYVVVQRHTQGSTVGAQSQSGEWLFESQVAQAAY